MSILICRLVRGSEGRKRREVFISRDTSVLYNIALNKQNGCESGSAAGPENKMGPRASYTQHRSKRSMQKQPATRSSSPWGCCKPHHPIACWQGVTIHQVLCLLSIVSRQEHLTRGEPIHHCCQQPQRQIAFPWAASAPGSSSSYYPHQQQHFQQLVMTGWRTSDNW